MHNPNLDLIQRLIEANRNACNGSQQVKKVAVAKGI
jgi:hypothetical protein